MATLNYPGSSGYGANPTTGLYGPLYTPPPGSVAGTDPTDYPIFDVTTGKLKSVKTGKAWTSALPAGWSNPYGGGAGGGGGGVQVPFAPPGTTINPNDPNQRYQPVSIPKQPDVASAQQDLMKTFKTAADNSLKGFTDYLSSFQADLQKARGLTADATNITPTVTALTGAANKFGTDLSASNAQYQQALAESAARQRGIIGQEQASLPMYDTALNNIEAAQLAALQRNVGRYKLGTGTPTSLGTDEMNILARGAAEVALPIEQSKIQRQYDIYGNALPVEAGLGAARINYAGSFLPTIAGSQYGASTNLATTVQNLKTQVANMSTQQAIAFLQAQGVPPQIMQQVLSGQISELGGLSALESGANYQGLQDVLGTYLSQPTAFNTGTPALPTYAPGRYSTSNSLGPNAPITVSPGGPLGNIPGGIGYRPLPGSVGGPAWTPPPPAAAGPTYEQYVADQQLAGLLGG